jgi:hypothetical protein
MSIRNQLLQDILSAIGGGGSVLWGSITGDINTQADLAQVAKTNDYDDLINKFDPTTDIAIERLLDGLSTELIQEPTGTGAANSIQIEFGPAFGTGADPISMLADGTITANQAGTYRAKVALQFGRSGASGTSLLLFRVRVNGVQAGRSIAAKLNNSNEEQYFENDTWLTVPAGAELRFDLMRDDSGNDSGGLFGILPTIEAGSWNNAPSAAIRIERWV